MNIFFFFLVLGAAAEIRNWNPEKVFSYKEIKAATNNFKEVIGRGSFGSVYFGKLRDGKLVAVKVRFDKTQLGADSFVNEVRCLNEFLLISVFTRIALFLESIGIVFRCVFCRKFATKILCLWKDFAMNQSSKYLFTSIFPADHWPTTSMVC